MIINLPNRKITFCVTKCCSLCCSLFFFCASPGRSSLLLPPFFISPPVRSPLSPPPSAPSEQLAGNSLCSACAERNKKVYIEQESDRLYNTHIKIPRSKELSVVCCDLCCSAILTTHTNVALLWFSCNAFALDSRQAFTTPSSTAGGAERTDKHCRGSSRLQLQSPRGKSGLKVLLAEMLAAEVGVGCGDPLGACALDLLLPFAKRLRVLGEFKQRHTVFGSFATSIGHTVIGHIVLS